MEEQQQALLGTRAHATVFGVSMIGTTILDVAARGGGIGFIVGGAAAAIIASQSNKLFGSLQSSPTLARINQTVYHQQRGSNGERTFGQRLMGIHPPMEGGEIEMERTSSDNEDYQYDDTGEDIIPSLSLGKNAKGIFTFSQVLDTGFIPTLKKIYVGSLPDGTPLFVEAKELCHVALGGNTGGGKSSLLRMLMMQLCKAGAIVYLLNPHYTVYDREHDEDWTPFTSYLKEDPLLCSEYPKIQQCLEQLAGSVLTKRINLVKAGQLPGRPCFVIIDELPAIVKKCPNVPGFMEELLREGRKYGIYLIVGSQDFLVKTIGTEGGAVRQCFRTGYYVGGDPTTAKNLLEQGIAIDETSLGKGVAMLRCAATQKTVKAKVPYVDNASLYRLLGPSTFAPIKGQQSASPELPVLREQAVQHTQPRPEITVEQLLALAEELRLRQTPPVYSQINNKQPINGGVYQGVNEPVEPDGNIIKNVFINREINAEPPAQNSETANVSEETRKHIRGMVKANISHREISKIVGLYGPKYRLYQMICVEEGIKIEKEA